MTADAPHHHADPVPPGDAPRSGIRRRYLVFVAVALLGFAGSTAFAVSEMLSDGDGVTTLAPEIAEDGTITYVIPAGTRARINAGEEIAIIPASVTVRVGQTLVLRNEDTDTHIAGPFFVGPGEESSYSFGEPKVIAGDCTIHPSGRFEVRVVE